MKTVIIGGVAGGASCAARLRRLDEQAEIVMLERGEYISFANCGLPYHIGGDIPRQEALTLQTPESFRARFGVDVRVLHQAVAIFPATKQVRVKNLKTGEEYDQPYDSLVLAPGAAPIRPNLPGADHPRVFTLRNIPDTLAIKKFIQQNRPTSALVVGGGYIGVEMAENLTQAGLAVTIVERAEHVIAPLDLDMAADVHRYLTDKGICLELNNGVTAIAETDQGLSVTLTRGERVTDMVILSVGVRPETELARQAGIAVNAQGGILVDQKMRTNLPHVYAVGDGVQVTNFVTVAPGMIPLAGPANKQGRIAAYVICGLPAAYNGTQGSSVLKVFDMTVATTGLSQAAAEAAGLACDKVYAYSASHATYYPGSTMMSIKVLWNKETLQILGAQIVGFDGVDKRMDVLATALRLGAKITQLTQLELCYAPPFGSAKDPVNMVGFMAENVISGKVKQFFWQDVADLPRDGSVTLLDVRTAVERAQGHIPGFMHIPLDSLRENLSLIPVDKPIYVHCHSGQRSYIACRILSGHGYDCYNLAGGWRLYESVMHQRAVPPYNCTQCK